MTDTFTLKIRRRIAASAATLFRAWTTPTLLREWWGPNGVDCVHAEVDLRVGGRYLLDNRLPDGRMLRIHGTFLRVERPHVLEYTWQVGEDGSSETVTVRFDEQDGGTEVTVTHLRIPTQKVRDQHVDGWQGCLDGLKVAVRDGSFEI